MESMSNQLSSVNLGTLNTMNGAGLTSRTDQKFDQKFQLDDIQSLNEKILVEQESAPKDIFEQDSEPSSPKQSSEKKYTLRDQTTPKRDKNIGEVL